MHWTYDQIGRDETDHHETLMGALQYAAEDLRIDSDMSMDHAHVLADSEDYKAAWFAIKASDEAHFLKMNVDNIVDSWYFRKERPPAYRGPDGNTLLMEAAHRLLDKLADVGICINPCNCDDPDVWVEDPFWDEPYEIVNQGVIIQPEGGVK